MAMQPLVPVTLNMTVVKGAAQSFNSAAVLDLTGAAVDISAYDSMVCEATAITPGVNTADVSFGTVTGTALGVINVVVAATDFGTASPGSARVNIKGKKTSGDPVQLLATGTLTLIAG
jgi:hypothetical protein